MTTEPRPLWRRLLGGWLAIAARFGEVQTLIVLTLVYTFVIGPFAMAATLARRDLLKKRGLHQPISAWGDADSRGAEPEHLKHQF